MKALSPYLFIHIGLDVRLLRHCQHFSIADVVVEARKLLANLIKAEFAVSTEGSNELEAIVSRLESEPDKQKPISEADVSLMNGVMAILEKIVFAESQTKRIYDLTEGRFNLDSLMNHPEKMLAPGVYAKLPFQAKIDLKEAFMCIVLARPTASAVHILRATESILREYYKINIRRGRDANPMWGPMVIKLNTRKDKDQPLLQKLDFIRTTYRNPTNHPEANYTVESAQDLLGLCVDVLNAMCKSIQAPAE